MQYRELKRIATESVFNPQKPTLKQRIILDVGNPEYWLTKAMELLMEAKASYDDEKIKDAITLLILVREKKHEA